MFDYNASVRHALKVLYYIYKKWSGRFRHKKWREMRRSIIRINMVWSYFFQACSTAVRVEKTKQSQLTMY